MKRGIDPGTVVLDGSGGFRCLALHPRVKVQRFRYPGKCVNFRAGMNAVDKINVATSA